MSKTNSKRKYQYYASPTWTNPALVVAPVEAPVVAPVLDYSSTQWDDDCLYWRGQPLTGEYAHWCPNWDDLPMDETCPEWPCNCGIVDITPENPPSHDE